jgi:hypothetical protein
MKDGVIYPDELDAAIEDVEEGLEGGISDSSDAFVRIVESHRALWTILLDISSLGCDRFGYLGRCLGSGKPLCGPCRAYAAIVPVISAAQTQAAYDAREAKSNQ